MNPHACHLTPLNALSFPAITRGQLQALQVNLTYQCYQRCLHCHVNAGPTRTEAMSAEFGLLLAGVWHARLGAEPVRKKPCPALASAAAVRANELPGKPWPDVKT